MSKYTQQTAFNKAGNHLLKQGRKSYNREAGMCMFRGPEGRKCALGALILDSEYTPGIEGGGANCVKFNVPSLANLDTGFLHQLQNVHDDFHPNSWRKKLKALAETWNLSARWLR